MGSKGIVTARYGGLTSPFILKPEFIENLDETLKEMNAYTDDQTERVKPEDIRDPFVEAQKDGPAGTSIQ